MGVEDEHSSLTQKRDCEEELTGGTPLRSARTLMNRKAPRCWGSQTMRTRRRRMVTARKGRKTTATTRGGRGRHLDTFNRRVPLFNILEFDFETVTEVVRLSVAQMRYRVMRRFTKNNFFIQKNPTLVNFPVKNLELKDYIPLPKPKENEKLRSKYDLIANIVHNGKPGEGRYRVSVQQKSEEAWYEMQDFHVTETLPQMVALSEAYMQINI